MAKTLYQLSGIASEEERLFNELGILEDSEFHLELELKVLELSAQQQKLAATKTKKIEGQYFE